MWSHWEEEQRFSSLLEFIFGVLKSKCNLRAKDVNVWAVLVKVWAHMPLAHHCLGSHLALLCDLIVVKTGKCLFGRQVLPLAGAFFLLSA